MTPRELFRRYADERKAAVPEGYKRDAVSGVTRYTPIAPALDGIVVFSEIADSLIEDAISTQIAYFESIGRAFEWKVYSFDLPVDLVERLEARGFERGPAEGFLLYRVRGHRSQAVPDFVRIERINTASGIRQVVQVQEQVWGRSLPWLERSLCASQHRTVIFCAYVGGAAVGSGWIEFLDGSTFAELHGGAVLPAERNQGIYSALFDVRVKEAKNRGIEFLAVDAAPMSRPILLKKGFIHVCDTIPLRKECG